MRNNNPKSSRFSAGAASARLLFLAIGLTAVAAVAAIGVDAKLLSMFQDTDLGVTKLGPDTTTPGANITYTITVNNAGPDNADNATLTDPLPAGTTFVSIVCPAGWDCSSHPAVGVNGTVTATKPSLPPTSGDVFTLVVHVSPATPLGTFITNQATVSSSTFDVNDENDSSTFSTLVPTTLANLRITKLGQPDSVTPDSEVAYTMTVGNSGPDAAANVVFNDPLPAPVDFISLVSPAGWSCSTPSVNTNGTVHCTKTTLTVADGPQTFTLVGHFSAGLTPSPGNPIIVTNQATVSSDTNDPDPDNNVYATATLVFSCVANPVVTSSLDSGPGSLRQAIHDACVGDNITFDMTQVTSPITLTSGELAINKGLTITGPNTLTISGNNLSRIFNINASAATVSISGLTLRDGKPVGGGFGGGAILIENGASAGAVNLTGLTITNNDVSAAGNPLGGGIDNDGGVVTIDRCSVVNNVATFRGGAIQNQGFGSMVITNSTIAGNTAGTTGIGGGIRTLSPLTLTNDTIFGNSAQTAGNISNSGGTITFGNTIIAGGTLVGSGGSGPDINGTGFSSSDFNLIQDTSTGTITGTTTHNITGVSPNLQALGNYGGTTPTLLPKPASPVINAGDTGLVSGTDQRGFLRFVGGRADVGAVEANYTITATAGTPQSAVINAAFVTPLQATVQESGSNQNGVPVTFAPPVGGASGAFTGSATVNTAASGIATAPTFTANGTAGGPYNVVASIGTGMPTASFALTNTKAATATAVSALPNPSSSGQSVTFTATVTSTAGTPTGTVQFKDGGTNLGSPQTLNGSGVATFSTSSLVVGGHTITADYSGDLNFLLSSGTLSGGQQVGAIITFSASAYNTTESSRSVTITVQRSGDLTSAVTVDYAAPDDSAATPTILPCSTPGFVSARCDFTTAIGTLKFAANETSKTFVVLISQDNYVEGAEQFALTLSNPSSNAALGSPSTATLTIADDVVEPAANPIDDSTNFVRQHYHDFLNREPDPTDLAGLNFWVSQIESCGADQACRDLRRQNVSAAFFLSIEFQQTGYYVYRTYKTAFADLNPPTVPVPVRYRDFVRDTQVVQTGVIVGQGAWQAQLDANKQAYALAFVTRPDFIARYPAMTATAFVDALNANAGSVLTPTERTVLIGQLSFNPADVTARAQVLMTIAENALLKQNEMNKAFVLMQYFGYLRRNPDAAPEAGLNFGGYNFWLNKLNSFNGNFLNAEMVKAFITSAEYRKRFGQ